MPDTFDIIARHQQVAPVSLEAIARDLGIEVIITRLSPDDPGHLTRDAGSRSGYAIYVNSTNASYAQRFALAKEIAHYALHRDLIEQGVVRNTAEITNSSDFFDSQATNFAAHILMPIHLVEKYRGEIGEGYTELQEIFGVSGNLLKTHIVNLMRVDSPKDGARQ